MKHTRPETFKAPLPLLMESKKVEFVSDTAPVLLFTGRDGQRDHQRCGTKSETRRTKMAILIDTWRLFYNVVEVILPVFTAG